MTLHIDIVTNNIEMTPAINRRLTKRLRKIDRFIRPDDTSAKAQVEISKVVGDQQSGDIFQAEINLHKSGGQFYASSKKESLYDAIDDVQEEILRELKKEKGKRRAFIRDGGRKLKDLLRMRS